MSKDIDNKVRAIVLMTPKTYKMITSSQDIGNEIKRLEDAGLLIDEAGFTKLKKSGIFDKIEALRRAGIGMTFKEIFSAEGEYALSETDIGMIKDVFGRDPEGKSILDFRLTERVEGLRKEIEETEAIINDGAIPSGMALIRPLLCALCASESYYHYGQKSVDKTISRYPLILLHEGVAEVLATSDKNQFFVGQKVIVNPLKTPCDNRPREEKCYACQHGQRGLCEKTTFMGSTSHGLARSHLLYPTDLLLPIPEGISDEVAAITEPIATCYQAIRTCRIHEQYPIYDRVAVIGTGPMGYYLLAILSFMFKVPKKSLLYIGKTKYKLEKGKDFAVLVNSAESGSDDIAVGRDYLGEERHRVQIVFECAGGTGMNRTINTAIKILVPAGICCVLGLSDQTVPTDWIDAVNKGIRFQGVSRSRRADFERILRNLKINPPLIEVLSKGVERWNTPIQSVEEFKTAFEFAHPDITKDPKVIKPSGRLIIDISKLGEE